MTRLTYQNRKVPVMAMTDRDGIELTVINDQLGGMLDYYAGEINDIATGIYSLFVAYDGRERHVTWNEVLEMSDRLRLWALDIRATVEFQQQRERVGLRCVALVANLSAFNIYRYAMEGRHRALTTTDRPIIWFTREPTEDELEWLRLFARAR